MNENTLGLIQTQMNNERYNAQMYFYIASACEFMAYDGFASFFRKQAAGELEHAHKFAEFLISKRVMPNYWQIAAPTSGMGLLALATAAATLERKTTEDLKTIYELCDDPQVYALLDWFLTEQIEEETWSADLMDLVSRTDATGWIVLDEKYGKY